MQYFLIMVFLVASGFLKSSNGVSAERAYGSYDCLLFQSPDLQGNVLTSKVEEIEEFQASLPADFNDRIGSVWVRDGYVLEVYQEVNFTGPVLSSMSWKATAARDSQDGTHINLQDIAPEFNQQISSYRCRVEGTYVDTFRGTAIDWYEGQTFSWRSAGNHADHITVSMFTDLMTQEPVVKIHGDSLYGSRNKNFTIMPKSGKITANYDESGYAKGKVEFDMILGAMRPEFGLILADIADLIDVIANKPQIVFGTATPSRPELNSLRDWLNAMVHD